MGYYTLYTIEIVLGDVDLIVELRNTNTSAEFAFDDNGLPIDTVKWYDHDIDLKQFTEKHPNTLIKLMGNGEETGDLWHSYYFNGKVQYCPVKMTYDEFDPKKLE
jgi:hypothetical protein